MAIILIIDDEPGIRRSLRRILESDGHEVMDAEDGRVALRLEESTLPDLIITDVFMPEMDGIEFLLEHQETHPGIPIIAISGGGFADKEFVLKDADMIGAVATLSKPLGVDEVLAAVAKALEGTSRDE
jgi:DNA-binding NtrC family response regulator